MGQSAGGCWILPLCLFESLDPGGGGGTCFDFHSGSRGSSPPPPSAQVHLKTWVLGTFFSHGKNFFGACSVFFRRLQRMPYTVYILLHVCSISLVFQTTMPQRSLLVYFGSRVPPLPRAKREDVIDALLYFRFKDRITGHKRQKAEVPSDPESVDDEALPDNLSDVSHSGSDSDLSSSSGSSSSSTTDGGSSSGESNSD